jgi:hypothetical protein
VPSPTYRKGVTLDLTEATLVDADFSNCHLDDASFVGATFTGDAGFGVATFENWVTFVNARIGDGDRDVDLWPAGRQVDPDTRRVVRVPVEEKPERDAEPE